MLTLPFELRARLAYDGELFGAVTRIFVDSALAWYQRQMRARGVPGGKSGAVTVVRKSKAASSTAKAGDAVGREALCKYVLRPPIANERVQLLGDDLVRLVLERPFSDGTFALDLDPLALLVRLATTVPPPGFHTIRYADVLAAASNWRARVVPPPPPLQPPTAHSDDYSNCTTDCATCSPKANDKPPTHRSGYRPWRELLMRASKIDVEHCDKCGGRMKLRALVMTSAGIERYLAWLGEPSEPPRLAPARDPPPPCSWPSPPSSGPVGAPSASADGAPTPPPPW